MYRIYTLKKELYRTSIHRLISILLFILIYGKLYAGIIYTDFPADMQLYARDIATNEAQVTLTGIAEGISTGSYIELRVYRGNNIFDTQTKTLVYQNNKADFSFQTTIQAELINYRFEIYTISAGAYTLDKTATNVVSGDAYIIDGQSNAVAFQRTGAASASTLESPFIRSFASGIDNILVGNNLNWYQGNADGKHTINGNIGQWGIKMARTLVNDYQIPIAVFNGAFGGSRISYHTRRNDLPTDLNTNYGRLLYRLQQAQLADKVRAIIWYQGESDSKSATPLQTYKNYFYNMYKGWMTDYPNIEKLYIVQVRKSCNGYAYYFGRIQEAHRQLARELPNTSLMTAKGVPLWSDDCHFPYLNGYEKIGERIANMVKNDLYNENILHTRPPDILNAEFINANTLMMTTTNPNDVLVWEQGAEADFNLIGNNNANVTSGSVQDNRLYLTVSGGTNNIYGVTYYGRNGAGVTAPFVKNTAGIGMASFYDFPVGEPVMGITDDSYTFDEDAVLNGDVFTNDYVINSSGWLMNPLVSNVNSGTLSLLSNGDFSYTPNEHFNGTDNFTYEICSAARPDYCQQAAVQITINPMDDAPYAYDDIFSITENSIATGNVLINDKEVDGDKIILNINPLTLPANGNVIVEALGGFTYTPDMDFYGTDEFSYQICDDTPSPLCDTAWVKINVEIGTGGNTRPVAVADALTLNEDAVKSGNVLNNDSDDDGHDLLVTPNPLTPPLHGAAIVSQNGLYYYLPNQNFNGVDSFTYEICDIGIPSLCDTAWVMLNVLPVNDAPKAVNDTIYNNAFDVSTLNILDNDIDPDNDDLTIVPGADFTALNGQAVIQNNGVVNYQPLPGFVGTEQFTYEICDTGTPAQCDEATITILVESDCIYLNIQAFMEGAYSLNTQEMTTGLNTSRGLLPGQTPINNLVSGTPAGQPYSLAPWNYAGQEGADWTNDNYTNDAVDWVLVSFRLSEDKASQIAQTAALLNKDGSIDFPDRCVLSADWADPMYIVIEHRNHIGIMSPQPVTVTNQVLSYDFRGADSYSTESGYGQKEISTGVWAMFAGDGDQSDDFSYDINGEDKQIWYEQNGVFDIYLQGDYNLDGDINGLDKGHWMMNNGISSRVPK